MMPVKEITSLLTPIFLALAMINSKSIISVVFPNNQYFYCFVRLGIISLLNFLLNSLIRFINNSFFALKIAHPSH